MEGPRGVGRLQTHWLSVCMFCLPHQKTARTVGLSLLRLPQGLARGGLIITLLGQPPAGPPAKQSGLWGALQDRGKPADSSPTLGLSSHGPHTWDSGRHSHRPQSLLPGPRRWHPQPLQPQALSSPSLSGV